MERAEQAMSDSDETLDILFRGRLKFYQNCSGYRFSLDAVLLAYFATIKATDRIADLGTGSGVIPVIVAFRYPLTLLMGLEVQERLALQARRNVELNGLSERIQIIHGDVSTISQAMDREKFDAVLCNPPYRKASSGRMNPNAEKKIARHEITGTLQEFLTAGRYLLRLKGRMTLVYPAVRCVDLLHGMRNAGLEPKRLRMVHSFAQTEATLVLVEGIKGGKSGVKVLPPLIIYRGGKNYSSEIQAMLDGTMLA